MNGQERAAIAIKETCKEIEEMLLQKNQAYGNSAFEPVRIFSKAPPKEQILVRLDDKISRLTRGEAAGEDVFLDLIGYLIIHRAHDKYNENRQTESTVAPSVSQG